LGFEIRDHCCQTERSFIALVPMRQTSLAAVAALGATANAASLSDVCTVSNVQAALPANGTLPGIDLIPSTVTASALYNATASMGSTMTYTYCNVTIAYTHTSKGDRVVLKYAFPSPSDFENRFYVGGGGGYSLSSDATGGLAYGAVGGATDAGYDAFDYGYDDVVLYGNGSINWDATYMFGYQALGEMAIVGKTLTTGFYDLSSDTKIYTYFEGCSDGGREGMSQVQRWGEQYDGVIAGAPAFRFAQQQVLHVFSSEVEVTLDYYPPPCELDKIVNVTIAACDPLDGRADGIVSRTDLCKLSFNLSSIIGESYYCPAENSTSLGFGFNKRQHRMELSLPKESLLLKPFMTVFITPMANEHTSRGRFLLSLEMQLPTIIRTLVRGSSVSRLLVASMSPNSFSCWTSITSLTSTMSRMTPWLIG
jgi:tannase